MTSDEAKDPAATSASQLNRLRGNCMGAAVLLFIEFAIGTAVNLYVTVPKGKSFLSAVFNSAILATHAIVALLLLATAIAALVRAIRARRAVVLTSLGLVAILVAAASGSSFVGDGSNGSSLGMALAAAVAMFCYVAAIFTLR